MKNRIFRLILIGIALNMTCSCHIKQKKELKMAEEKAANIEQAREEALKRFTPMQKLMAEKAAKLPAENNPVVGEFPG